MFFNVCVYVVFDIWHSNKLLITYLLAYYPRKYKTVFKLKNATWNQNSQGSNPFVAAHDLLEKVQLFIIL